MICDRCDCDIPDKDIPEIVFDLLFCVTCNAKFDPSKKDSANLLAGAAGGGLVAAIMARQNKQEENVWDKYRVK